MDVAFELIGAMPLILHADDIEERDRLADWRKDPKNKSISVAGDDRTPAWTWQTYLTHDGKNIAIPCEYLMTCLRQAGAQLILRKQKTFKEVTQSGMLITGEFVDFLCDGHKVPMDDIRSLYPATFKEQANAARKMGFALWAKPVRVGPKKHIRVRPRFDKWSCSGVLRVFANAPELTFATVSKLFELAGRVGIGDWRPGCKTPGSYGMFTAKMTQLS